MRRANLSVLGCSNSPLTAALESRNDEQTAADRNQVLEQSNVEIWLAQEPYEPNAGLIAGETTNDSADQSQPSTNESRPSTAKRNAGTREATLSRKFEPTQVHGPRDRRRRRQRTQPGEESN